MKQYWFGVQYESQWGAGSSWKLAYPDGRNTDAGEIVEAVPVRRLVICWQHQNKSEFKAEGESHCTMELGCSGPAVNLSGFRRLADGYLEPQVLTGDRLHRSAEPYPN